MNNSNNRNIPQALRSTVWRTYIGKKFGGICFCCGKIDINPDIFECGHVKSLKDGGETTVDNLRPICSLCNRSMGSKHMEEFMKSIGVTKSNNWSGLQQNEFHSNSNEIQKNSPTESCPISNFLEKEKIKNEITRKENKKNDSCQNSSDNSLSEKSNSNNKKFPCSSCSKSFSRKFNLIRHQKESKCKNKFKCECGEIIKKNDFEHIEICTKMKYKNEIKQQNENELSSIKIAYENSKNEIETLKEKNSSLKNKLSVSKNEYENEIKLKLQFENELSILKIKYENAKNEIETLKSKNIKLKKKLSIIKTERENTIKLFKTKN